MHADDAPLTESSAWNLLRHMADELVKLFGKPGEIARCWDMPARDAAVLTQWLRALEAWLRRLLLMAAGRITLDPPSVQHKARAPHKTSAPGVSVASDSSADWRVSFALSPRVPKPARRRQHRAPQPPRAPDYSHFALAMRFEALLRVAADPAPFARRLARIIARAPATPNRVFHQKIRNMGPLELYVRQATLLVLDVFPNAWTQPDSS